MKPQIIVIGTQPPCPRCRLLSQAVHKKVEEFNIDAELVHLAFTDEKAIEFAKSLGLEAGTAKHVAKKAGLKINLAKLDQIVQNPEYSKNTEFKEINDCNWSPQLDEYLKPFQELAKNVGILMTPVLVINGELKHSGSVPPLAHIEKWMLELKN